MSFWQALFYLFIVAVLVLAGHDIAHGDKTEVYCYSNGDIVYYWHGWEKEQPLTLQGADGMWVHVFQNGKPVGKFEGMCKWERKGRLTDPSMPFVVDIPYVIEVD